MSDQHRQLRAEDASDTTRIVNVTSAAAFSCAQVAGATIVSQLRVQCGDPVQRRYCAFGLGWARDRPEYRIGPAVGDNVERKEGVLVLLVLRQLRLDAGRQRVDCCLQARESGRQCFRARGNSVTDALRQLLGTRNSIAR